MDAFIGFCRSEEEVARLEDIGKLFMSAYFNHRREQYHQIHIGHSAISITVKFYSGVALE